MNEKISLRKTFGETIQKLGLKYKNFVVLDADISNSLHTLLFAKSFPDRHYSFNGQEPTMVNTATGMTARGKTVFVCGKSATLIGRAWEQIRNSVAYPNLNIKIIGSNAGLSAAEEGNSEQILEDIALMRLIPNLKIIVPADAIQTRLAVETMLLDYGPTYLRLPREASAPIYDPLSATFEFGQMDKIKTGEDICIFSTGIILTEVLKAASELDRKGTSTKVINISSLHDLSPEKLKEHISHAKLVVTVEDHSIQGGLGSAIIEALHLSNTPKIQRIGTKTFGESGKYLDLLRKHQMDSKGIYEQIKNWWFEV
jgi:transketolase